MQQAGANSTFGLPEQIEATPKWRGIGFRVENQQFVIAIQEVSEIVPVGHLTPVPLAQSWVLGIANVRGVLVTVVDLAQFLGKAPVEYDEQTRILVIKEKGIQTGILVQEILGLRQFDEDQDTLEFSSLDESVLSYVQRAFVHDRDLWGVFEMSRLTQDHRFKQFGLKNDETVALS